MKGLVFIQKENPYQNVNIEIEELIRQTKSIPLMYDYLNTDFDSIYEIIEENKNIDFIALWYDEILLMNLKSLYEFDIPIILHTGDCWSRLFGDSLKKIYKKHKPDILISYNKCAIPAFKDYIGEPIDVIWGPLSFNPNIMKNYGLEKIYDIGFSGKFSNYDDRRNLHNYLISRNDIKYRRFKRYPSIKMMVKNMNKCWMMFNSMQNSKLLYYNKHFIGNCFSKNFEIMACNSCLITRKFGDADDLGFKDKENCLLFEDMKGFIERLDYYLNHKEELSEITQNGYELVHKKHTVEIHIKKIVKELKEVL